MKTWLKRRKNVELYGTLLAEIPLEENYNILLRMTSEIFEEIFQLLKGNIPEENTDLRELTPPRLQGSYTRVMVVSIVLPTQL